MIFNRPYKTIGVEAGDERTVIGLDRTWGTVRLEDGKGNRRFWRPGRIPAAKGGVEVYRGGVMELRAGDRVRWTRNDPGSGLVNGEAATVESIEKDGVRFRLGDGSVARLADGDPQLRHMDRAWAATVHAFQGRTVDRIVAAMPAAHEAVFGHDPAHDRGDDRVARASDAMDRGLGDERERSVSRGPRRDSDHEKAAEPKHRSRDLDMGL